MLLLNSCNKCDDVKDSTLGTKLTLEGTELFVQIPLSTVVLIDKSISTSQHNIPQPTVSDLQPLITYTTNNGGSLAVGLITANSDKVFCSFRVLSKKPQKPIQPKREEYSTDFDFRDAQKAFQSELELYKSDLIKRDKEIEKSINSFKTKLTILLSGPADSEKTDIHRALNRSEVYHTSYSEFSPYTLLISDGIDDVSAPLSTMNIGAELYLVYGSDTPRGDWITKYDFITMSNLESAIDRITNK